MVYEVVIAGAGPVGLFLACELRLRGIAVLVLERTEETHSPLRSGFMGARGMNVPSVEAFYRRGMLHDVRGCAIGWTNLGQPGIQPVAEKDHTPTAAPRFAGHFAGIVLDANNIDFSEEKYIVRGPSASGGIVTLEGIETLLAERAEELGVKLRRGASVTGLAQDDEGVTVHLSDEKIRCRWLVGCDGGRSIVRKSAQFDFPGTDPEFTGYIAMADLADPEKLRPGWNLTPNGMYVNGPAPGRFGVVDFNVDASDRDKPITLESFQQVLRYVSGTDVTLTALHLATSYTDNARQATTYRKGRVLLAGDAAHVHSPLGGQGMNLGIGDAMNLGWKLAATIQGWAPDGLLDTYTEERHPIGAWALNWTRAQVAIMRPEPHARAMSAVVRELISTRGGATFFAQKIAGLWLRYPLPGDHPLIGHSAPDLEFQDKTRLGCLLHDGSALLLDLRGDESLHALSHPWSGQIKYVSAKAEDDLGLSAILVRPDGYVAWATDTDPAPDQLTQSLTRWFGKPE